MLRIIAVFIHFSFAILSSISPNFSREMGTKPGDKIYTALQSCNDAYSSFSYLILTFIFLNCLSIFHLIKFNELPLNMIEYILFLFSMCGFGMRMWCYITLGDFFTFTLGVRQDHKLITTGPYRYLVHPCFFAYVLQMCSTYIFLASYSTAFNVALIAILQLFLNVKRAISSEEKMMQENFGDAYAEYCNNRYRLIPGIY